MRVESDSSSFAVEQRRAALTKSWKGGCVAAILTGQVDRARGFSMRIRVAIAAPGCLHPRFEGAHIEDALLDTGATVSMLTDELISDLGLVETGQHAQTVGSEGIAQKAVFRFDMGFMTPPQIGNNFIEFYKSINGCLATKMSSGLFQCRLVIGMDILITTGLTLLPTGDFFLSV